MLSEEIKPTESHEEKHGEAPVVDHAEIAKIAEAAVPSSTLSTGSSTQTEHEVPDWLRDAEKPSTHEEKKTEETLLPAQKEIPEENPLPKVSSE